MSAESKLNEERRTGIGGSDVAAICGVDPWKGPVDVFLEKTGRRQVQQTEAMRFGLMMEPLLAEYYRDANPEFILDYQPMKLWRSAEWDFAICHPDGCLYHVGLGVTKPSRVFEAKTTSRRQAFRWGEEGTDEIPESALLQVQWNMWVVGVDLADIVAFVAEPPPKFYVVEANPGLQDIIVDRAQRFWKEHIEPDACPDPTQTPNPAHALRDLYPESTAGLIESTPHIEELAVQLCQVRAEAKAFKESEEAIKIDLKSILGDAEGVETALGKIWWKSHERRQVKWEAVCKEAGVPQEIIDRHTTQQIVRSFKPYLKFKENSNG